jgi:glutamate-1-semialdehyde aminotransferase
MSDPVSEDLKQRAEHLLPGGVNSPVRAFLRVGDWHDAFGGLSYDVLGARGALLNDPVRLTAGGARST